MRPISEAPPTADFTVTAPPGEQASLRANVEGLKQLAEQSRGRFYLEMQAERLFDELLQNHSLNHRQTFISNKLIDVYKGEYKHVNLVEVETKKGFPIFEYSSNWQTNHLSPTRK